MSRAVSPIAALLLLSASHGCSGSTAGTTRSTDVGIQTVESAAPPRAEAVKPQAIVTASLQSPDGEFWGTLVSAGTDPALLALPCYETALKRNARLQGWLYVDIDLGYHTAKLAESSPLPVELTDCIVEKARALRVDDELTMAPATLYLSLSTSPR